MILGLAAALTLFAAQSAADPRATTSDDEGAQDETTEAATPQVEASALEERRGGASGGLRPQALDWIGPRLYWDQGPRLDLVDGDLTLVTGGRLQIDGATFSESEAITETFGEPDPGFDLRRAYIDFGLVAKDRFELRVQLDLAASSTFKDLYAGVYHLPYIGQVRAGYFKEPFGLEELASSNDTTFMERGLSNALVPKRNLGVMITENLTNRRLSTAALGMFRSSNGSFDTTDGWSVTGRVTALPVYEQTGRRLLHLGASASYRQPSNDSLRFRTRPESHQAQYLADTLPFAAERDLRLGLEMGANIDSVSFQSELVFASVDGPPGAGSPLYPAGYFTASWILTGEHRSYRRNIGVFGRVQPTSKAGAVELAMRTSYIDLDSAGVDGGSLHDVTAGVNWYVNNYVRLMFNYVAARPDGFGTEHIFQTRLQIAL